MHRLIRSTGIPSPKKQQTASAPFNTGASTIPVTFPSMEGTGLDLLPLVAQAELEAPAISFCPVAGWSAPPPLFRQGIVKQVDVGPFEQLYPFKVQHPVDKHGDKLHNPHLHRDRTGCQKYRQFLRALVMPLC